MTMQLAFIVPYRDRASHLREFVPHYRRRFPKAHIYIIEQGDNKPFNRAKLLNVGFKEFQHTFDYCAMHDIDMLCTKGDYSPPPCPTQLATHAQQFKYKMPFSEYFGGVTLFRKEDFILCNGYSNNFWSWGGEDNEMRANVLACGLQIAHRDCWYESLKHHRISDPVNYPKNVELMNKGRQPADGLSHCEYKVIKHEDNRDYIKLTVEL